MQVKLIGNTLFYKTAQGAFKAPYSEKALNTLQRAGHDLTAVKTLNGALKRRLHNYQVTAVVTAAKNGGSLLLADDMGLGKTASAIATMVNNKSKKTLIVVPSNVKLQWKREITSWLTKPKMIKICSGRTFNLSDALQVEKASIVIINYNILEAWSELLCSIRWDFAILDEGQNIKKSSAGCTQAMIRIREFVDNCMVLTGTPLTDRNSDIFWVVWMVNRNLFPSEPAFMQKYCLQVGYDGVITEASVNTLELNHILTSSGVMLRRTKSQVQTRFGVKLKVVAFKHNTATLDMIESEVAKAERLVKHSYGKYRSSLKFQIQRSIEQFLQEAIRIKLPDTIRWVEDFMHRCPDKKLVIACVHRELCGMLLAQHFGDRAVRIDGSNTPKQRDTLIQKFRNDKSIQLLIGNIKSVGTGLDGLQHVCNTMVLCEFPWSPGELNQLFARLDRQGQSEDVTVYLHVVHNTMDAKMAKTLDRKANTLSEVLDGKSLDANKKLTKLIKEQTR